LDSKALSLFQAQIAPRIMVATRTSGRRFHLKATLHLPGLLLFTFVLLPSCADAQTQTPAPAPQKPADIPAQPNNPADVARGQKLILKDGTFQVVREYRVNGDRVRYFSLERGDWEELPVALIDWDATAKEEKSQKKAAEALTDKVHAQEEAKRMDNVADIDASLQVGQGAFLPDTDGLFVVEGKTIRPVKQAVAGAKADKLRTVEQVLSPVPIVPGKQKVFLAGEHATIRLRTTTPEFYLREPPPDPDRVSRIETSSRPGESGPDVVLVRAKEMRNGREIMSIKTLFGEKIGANVDEIKIQRWEVAPHVYRFTLGEALTPGEYVLAEILPDGLNYFVWDFGLDAAGTETKAKK
jgi:hypothetical protein